MTVKTFLLIYNPVAGAGEFKHRLDEFIAAMRARECLVMPLRTDSKEDVPILLSIIKIMPVDGVLAAGGDGTIHETANYLLTENIDVPLGIIPYGTSNDMAAFLDLPKELDACAEIFAAGYNKALDVGMVNGMYFLNVASAGLLSSVGHSVDRTLKSTLGKLAYYLKGFEEVPRFRTIPMKITADGRVIEDNMVLFLVMNGGIVGSFTKLAPQARMDDGKLDVVIVHRCSLRKMAGIMISLLSGTHFAHKEVEHIQAAEILIESGLAIGSDLDGELGPELPLKIRVVPQRLRVYMKAD